MHWLVLKLADTAFPTGGFAHSYGLEAAVGFGFVDGPESVRRFVSETVWQAALGGLPFVRGAYASFTDRAADAAMQCRLEEVARVDAACQAFLSSTVANRASRTQGRAFVSTAARIFDSAALAELHDAVRKKRTPGHHAVLFGACLGDLGVSVADAEGLYLHLALRSVTSAAVRLGLLGPHESHTLEHQHGALLDRALDASHGLGPDDAAQSSPLLEIFGNHHDDLYSRLFSS